MQSGVYYSAKGLRPDLHKDVSVPPAFSPEFFQYLATTISHPADNPVFMREFRRFQRRLPFPWKWFTAITVIGFFISLLGGILAAAFFNRGGGLSVSAMTIIYLGAFLAPAYLLSLLGFFFGLQGSSFAWNRATLDELAVCLIKPQEIVFGHIAGAVFPLFWPALFFLPGFALFAADYLYRLNISLEHNTGTLLGFVIMFYPHALASLLASASVAESTTFGERGSADSLLKPLGAWLFLGSFLNGALILLFITGIFQTNSTVNLFFWVCAPVLTVMKFAIAAGFLQRMAIRLAFQQQIESP